MKIKGTRGADRLIGTDNIDDIHGGRGSDVIKAKGNHDVVFGGRGNDRIVSGEGDDFLVGGAGRDTFVIDADALIFSAISPDVLGTNAGVDRILDFNPAKDTIVVRGELTEAAGADYSYDPAEGILYWVEKGTTSTALANVGKGALLGSGDVLFG